MNFKELKAKDIEGNEVTFDISKELGNGIYNSTTDIGELELARKIYLEKEVELSDEEKEIIKKYLDTLGFKAV